MKGRGKSPLLFVKTGKKEGEKKKKGGGGHHREELFHAVQHVEVDLIICFQKRKKKPGSAVVQREKRKGKTGGDLGGEGEGGKGGFPSFTFGKEKGGGLFNKRKCRQRALRPTERGRKEKKRNSPIQTDKEGKMVIVMWSGTRRQTKQKKKKITAPVLNGGRGGKRTWTFFKNEEKRSDNSTKTRSPMGEKKEKKKKRKSCIRRWGSLQRASFELRKKGKKRGHTS